MVAGGTIRIGFKSKEEDEVMRKYYIKNFPLPNKEHIDKMLPSEEDDKVV